MGAWAITVRGTGNHHNTGNPHDANRMAAHFVRALRDAGHQVTGATFTFGAEDEITKAERYLDGRNAIEGLDRRPRCQRKVHGEPCGLVDNHEDECEPATVWHRL